MIRRPKSQSDYDEVFVMAKIKQLVEPLNNDQLAEVVRWMVNRFGTLVG